MVDLIAKLKERQGEKGQVEFAAELGITQAALSRIYSGDRTIGLSTARKIKRRFPELTFDVGTFLLGENIPTDQEKIPA